MGYHSVKGMPIDGFVLCLLYDEDAACRLDMGFEACSNFMAHDCLRAQTLGNHSVKGLPIDGFVLCFLYDGGAARKLDMGFEVSSNFMFHICIVCSFLIDRVQSFVMKVTRMRAT